MLRLIGDLPSGTPVAFVAAFGWGWLVQLLEDYGFDKRRRRAPAVAAG
jgi:transposase